MHFRPRFLELLRNKPSRSNLSNDIMAGATVGLIALPLALALGVASVPAGAVTPSPAPALGIFTAIIAGVIISLFGGSRVQIGGPTAAFIPIVLLIIQQHGYSGLLLSTMMAGVILILMGITGLGVLIKYIPWPVTSGFTTGIAVSIMLTQTGDLLGFDTETPAPREFFERLIWTSDNLVSTNFPTLALSLLCCAGIYLWQKHGTKRIPGSILVMIASTLILSCTGLGEALHIATLGTRFGSEAIPSSLPGLQLPSIDMALIRELLAPASAIAILCAIESLLSAVVADGLAEDHHDSNTELVAQGIANLIGPLFGCLPATGAIARTSANISCGGRSPLAGITHAIMLLLVVLFLSKYASYIPLAAMASVLLMVSVRMGEWHQLSRLKQMPASDALVLLTTFLLTVIFDLVIAVEVGMLLAAILFIKRVSETTEVSLVTENDSLETHNQLAQGKEIPENVLVYRIFGPFLFGAAEKMQDALQRTSKLPKVLVIRMHLVTAMDMTALNALTSVVQRMNRAGGIVILSGVHHQPLGLMKQTRFISILGRDNLRGNFDEALARAREFLQTQTPS